MDGWQKLEVLSKVVAALFIPLAVAYLANQVAAANKQRDSETKFVELATTILSKQPDAKPADESRRLRQWAVDVINRFSGVPMAKETAEALVQNTALPPVPFQAVIAQPPDDAPGTWGVVFGGDATLKEAEHEVTKTAEKMGLGTGSVFRRAGSFRSVKVFVSRSEAEDAVGKARAVRPSSYVVNMSKWCPTSVDRQGYFECTSSAQQ